HAVTARLELLFRELRQRLPRVIFVLADHEDHVRVGGHERRARRPGRQERQRDRQQRQHLIHLRLLMYRINESICASVSTPAKLGIPASYPETTLAAGFRMDSRRYASSAVIRTVPVANVRSRP